ncbi:MAG: response regulator transcription factor [Prevotellaceae bacterium]|nr:response regulator transcription factor [Prevotellaceae bacterium]
MHNQIPKIAIIESNTLAVIGLKNILQDVMPIMTVDTFGSFDELMGVDYATYFHYFVSTNIVLDNRSFFIENCRKTIVLTASADPNAQLSDFHCLCINQPEQVLIKSILRLEQMAHGHGKNLPPVPKVMQEKILSDREIEVLSLIVQGYINKEIADKLNIGLATVVTHRRNIMEKLDVKSVSALTIYAVMHGYVDINKI